MCKRAAVSSVTAVTIMMWNAYTTCDNAHTHTHTHTHTYELSFLAIIVYTTQGRVINIRRQENA